MQKWCNAGEAGEERKGHADNRRGILKERLEKLREVELGRKGKCG